MQKRPIVLTNAVIYTPFQVVKGAVLVIEEDKIIYLGEEQSFVLPDKAHILDLSGCIVTPGLIDLHVHGAQGVDFLSTPPQEWRPALKHHTSQGTTSFLSALISAPHDQLIDTIEKTAGYCNKQDNAVAQCLGIHLEGPYLNPGKRGVHMAKYLRKPSFAKTREYIQAGKGWLKMITMAPELDPHQELIRTMVEQGIVVAAGHSEASYADAKEAIQAGLSYTVHTGNALLLMHQREPGVLGAVLEDKRVCCEVIADGRHLHPAMLRLFHKLKEPQRLVLATDSSPMAGLAEGTYNWQDQTIKVTKQKITDMDDRLAGSCLTMAQAVKNMLQWIECSLSEALAMATLNPARVLGIDNRKGMLAVGMDADIAVFDADLTVKLVIVGGEVVWP